jgi:hypothetical protein
MWGCAALDTIGLAPPERAGRLVAKGVAGGRDAKPEVDAALVCKPLLDEWRPNAGLLVTNGFDMIVVPCCTCM